MFYLENLGLTDVSLQKQTLCTSGHYERQKFNLAEPKLKYELLCICKVSQRRLDCNKYKVNEIQLFTDLFTEDIYIQYTYRDTWEKQHDWRTFSFYYTVISLLKAVFSAGWKSLFCEVGGVLHVFFYLSSTLYCLLSRNPRGNLSFSLVTSYIFLWRYFWQQSQIEQILQVTSFGST